jgi:Ca2+-binding RTX toxin-like protein
MSLLGFFAQMVGGSRSNTLTASGSGDNILIGDQGGSTINGGTGYNLLIGGTPISTATLWTWKES